MLILGVNAYHADSSAALLRDGEIIAAAEEERFRRCKHWAGLPTQAIRYCLEEGGVTLGAVNHLAINSAPNAHMLRKLGYALARRPDPRFLWSRWKNRSERTGLVDRLSRALGGEGFHGTSHYMEHHRAHLASAYLASPYDEAAVVSVDGFGDFSSAAWGIGKSSRIDIDGRVFFPHSLGIFYQALTQYLGFWSYGDEYKVMGLAPYGEPRFLNAMRELVRLQPDGSFRLNLRYFRHHRANIPYAWKDTSPEVGRLFSHELEALLGPTRAAEEPLAQKHMDLARSVQARFEEAYFHMLTSLHARHKVDALAVAGGCGMNSVANGKIHVHTPFREIYVQAAAGDAGGALGAALSVWAEQGGGTRIRMPHAYWGPAYDDGSIGEVLREYSSALARADCNVIKPIDEAELTDRASDVIAGGHVLGWFQGRMEWGPRALGNRSILGDPRRSDMKDILNRKIKRRESFRPFAPSVLRDAVSTWFESDADVPFMQKVFQIREDRREQIPAVTHVDGSGRLQTVTEAQNGRYHRLITAFKEKTGVPMVLNTSFNESEPVVCRPQEALDCFLRTNMDVLVLGDYLIERKPSIAA